jgi:hypothetical protein
MKTIFTLFSSLLLSISLLAADAKPKSILTVKSAERTDLRVILDGRRFEPGKNSLTIRGIDAGYHTIKIYRERMGGFFNILGRRYEVVYSSSIAVKPRTSVNISIDRFGRATVTESRIFSGNDRKNQDRGWGYPGNGKDNDYDRDRRDQDMMDDREFDFEDGGRYGDYDSNYGYGKGMNDREFKSVLQEISKEWLESNKMKSATQIVTTNSLSSAQVKQLVLLFNFESNKVELAKQAYRNTVDKNNYQLIYDAFSFSGSKDELARFIRQSR